MEVVHQEYIDLEHMADLCDVAFEREPPGGRDHSIWHVTNLLASARLIVKGGNSYYVGNGPPSGIMSLGRIWESAVDHLLADYAKCRGGVFVPDIICARDDISGSLDGIMFLPTDTGSPLVCETKLRFTMSEEIPFTHCQQIRAYCHLAYTDLACLVSGHVSSAPPMFSALLRILHFTRSSIQEAWQSLVNTKLYLERLGQGPTRSQEQD